MCLAEVEISRDEFDGPELKKNFHPSRTTSIFLQIKQELYKCKCDNGMKEVVETV